MVTEQLKGRGNTTTWFLFVARLDAGAHFVCTLLNDPYYMARLAQSDRASDS